MSLRLYLNGDGKARHSHMSLFLVIMRGKYDAILIFPFCFKVIFCLYDLSDQQLNIIDAFRPDGKSNSFQRPQSEMNAASGIPTFVPLTKIQQENSPYIRDDTMFIKAMIDFFEIPKEVLPYAVSLSPGLTTPIQQSMIRQETEKRQQQSASNSTTTNDGTNQSMDIDLQKTNTKLNISSDKQNGQIDSNNNIINCTKS
jgi:hypothetical protein